MDLPLAPQKFNYLQLFFKVVCLESKIPITSMCYRTELLIVPF